MWIQISTIAALCVFLKIMEVKANQNDALEIIFRERTQSDWEKVWHHESHSRCRERLVRHLYWACEKDIYRLTRRNFMPAIDDGSYHKRDKKLSSPWLNNDVAIQMLRTRRTQRGQPAGGSITAECCTRVGCTWEEYAEYCPSNKRINHYKK